MRLIDADALIGICKEVISKEWNKKAQPCSWSHAYAEFIDDIEDMPTVNRWHDIRKNPNDLPPNGTRVECQHLPNITTDKKDLVVMHYFIDGEFVYNWDVDTDIKSSTFGQRYYGDVIAWREIDPFEEVTE